MKQALFVQGVKDQNRIDDSRNDIQRKSFKQCQSGSHMSCQQNSYARQNRHHLLQCDLVSFAVTPGNGAEMGNTQNNNCKNNVDMPGIFVYEGGLSSAAYHLRRWNENPGELIHNGNR